MPDIVEERGDCFTISFVIILTDINMVGEFITGEIWTAGKYDIYEKRLMWRSPKSVDSLKRNLYWNKIYNEKKNCVYMELFNDTKSRLDDPRLGMASCLERRKFICEVKYFSQLQL
jgi:hypothetical protein